MRLLSIITVIVSRLLDWWHPIFVPPSHDGLVRSFSQGSRNYHLDKKIMSSFFRCLPDWVVFASPLWIDRRARVVKEVYIRVAVIRDAGKQLLDKIFLLYRYAEFHNWDAATRKSELEYDKSGSCKKSPPEALDGHTNYVETNHLGKNIFSAFSLPWERVE